MKGRKKKHIDSQALIEKLAARIKQIRKQRGYESYEDMALEAGFSRAQYGRYEVGQDLKFSSLGRVIQGLGVTWEEFFSEGFD